MAHDFNNILAAILGNADLARQDLPAGALARQSLHERVAALAVGQHKALDRLRRTLATGPKPLAPATFGFLLTGG